MKRLTGLAALVFAASLSGCTDEGSAVSALNSAGWTNISITDTNFINLVCADEEVAYHASGTNAQGKHVHAVVCCGYFFKGCTIRYE